MFGKKKSFVKKFLKIFLFIILGIAALLFVTVQYFSKPQPKIIEGSADEVAYRMLEALNAPAWDSLAYLQWTFMDMHHYKWDKHNHIAHITWDNNRVILNTKTVTGRAFKNEVELIGEDAKKVLSKAWDYWCNDSFWMFAPYKIFDAGTQRSLVETDKGKYGLMIHYTSGGVTPGDKYVWHLNQDYIPLSYDMFVEIIPVQGLNVSWDNWENIGNAKLSTLHGSKLFSMEMKNVKGGQSLNDIDSEISDFIWQ